MDDGTYGSLRCTGCIRRMSSIIVNIFVVGRALLSEISVALSPESRKISNITSALHLGISPNDNGTKRFLQTPEF